MAAIFDFRPTQTSNSIPTSLSVLPDPENMGIDMNFFVIMYQSWDTCNYIISAAILDFLLPVSSGSVTASTIEKFDTENNGIAVGILFLASLEAEIHLGVLLIPPSKQTSVK